MKIEFRIEYEDMDLLQEFTGKLEARSRVREEKWKQQMLEEEEAYRHRSAPPPRTSEPTEAEVAAVEAVLAEPEPVAASEFVSLEEATDVLHKFVAKKQAPAAMALFAEYGAKRLGDVPPERRAELVARMNEAL